MITGDPGGVKKMETRQRKERKRQEDKMNVGEKTETGEDNEKDSFEDDVREMLEAGL